MKTLKEIIVEKRIRKGRAEGTTKRGAYWVPTPGEYFAKLRASGGDGIGQSSPDVTHYLDIRHFRNGEVRSVVVRVARHQNGSYSGAGTTFTDASAVLSCSTIEEVMVALKGIGGDESVYGDINDLAESLSAIGLPDSSPAPDEE